MTDLRKWGLKKLALAAGLLGLVYLLSSCASIPVKSVPKASEILSCDNPEGYEYICYSDKECTEYFKAYSAVITERYEGQKYGFYTDTGDYQVVHMNLFLDHKSYSMIGRYECQRQKDGRIFIKVWTITCDLEGNLINEGYKEGYRR